MSYLIGKNEVQNVCELWNKGAVGEDAFSLIQDIVNKIVPNLERNDSNTNPNYAWINFDAIKVGEDLLEALFSEIREGHTDNTVSAVLLLDSIYHTQTHDAVAFGIDLKKLLEKTLLDDIRNAEDEDSEICTRVSCIYQIANLRKEKNNRYSYSFATKFCNWINPKAFPIFDSYVAWLLRNIKYENKPLKRKSFGRYDAFIEAYNDFIRNAIENGEQFDYKQIDTVMWTIGKIIGNQSTITYIEPERKNDD